MQGQEPEKESAAGTVQVPCHIFLPVVPAARVIGKAGASIKAIREQSGAAVRVLQKELPQQMQQREDRVVVVTGDPRQLRRAIAGVFDRVFDRSGLPPEATGAAKDRAHITEVLVPEKCSSHLVGQKGERIKTLIEETSCDLNVGKEPVPGLAGQKKVRIVGQSTEEVVGAVCRLLEVLGELVAGNVLKAEHFELREAGATPAPQRGAITVAPAPAAAAAASTRSSREVPLRLLIRQVEAAWVVGKRGNKIMKLRDLAKVQISDADSPPFDESDRVLEIAAAPLEQRLRALQMALEDLTGLQESVNETRLLLPTEQFGIVMGHRGETIRGIMDSTGAKLKQHKADTMKDGSEYRLRLLEVKGDVRQRLQAARLVYEALEQRGTTARLEREERIPLQPGLREEGLHVRAGLGAASVAALPASAWVGRGPAADPSRAPAASGVTALLEGLGAGTHTGSVGGDDSGSRLSLQLAMPSHQVAKSLASESSGVAWRAGVQLKAATGPGAIPLLQVTGTAVGNSVACYLIQDRLYTMH